VETEDAVMSTGLLLAASLHGKGDTRNVLNVVRKDDDYGMIINIFIYLISNSILLLRRPKD
jgi:hypothetical protein